MIQNNSFFHFHENFDKKDMKLFCSYCYVLRKQNKTKQKHYLWQQVLRKWWKQQVLGKLCHSIYQILKINFKIQIYIINYSYFALLSIDKKAKTISLKVFKKMNLKILQQETTKGIYSETLTDFVCWVKNPHTTPCS